MKPRFTGRCGMYTDSDLRMDNLLWAYCNSDILENKDAK